MPLSTDEAIRFGFLVHDISRLRRVLIDRELRPLGITRSQWWLLTFLSRRDGMTQSALAADLDMTKVAIGGLLERMEQAGLVKRGADELDARIRRVYLTRAGTRLINTIRKQIENVEQEIVKDHNEEEFHTTAKVLRQMRAFILNKVNTIDCDD